MPARNRSVRYGDPRVFFESTTTKPFVGPAGIKHDAGAVVRGSAFLEVNGQNVSVSLPSMAELIYYQSNIALDKAARIKAKALKVNFVNGSYHMVNEQEFFTYMQLCCVGFLGLYSSLEAMVYELYIRKYKDNVVKIDSKAMKEGQFTNLGIERKLSSVASQLSGKSNIYGTELFDKAKQLISLRTTVQHWDVERREDYFLNLPENHPLKRFLTIDPVELSKHTREILDHYTLKS
jgi:hypothetical protein